MGGKGGFPAVPPWSPGVAPGGRGGAPGGSGPGGPAANGGGAPFPRPPPTFGCQTLVQAFARAPCSPRQGQGRAGECRGRRLESAVSG